VTALTDHDYLGCAVSDWRGDEARCRWCDGWLRRGNTLFCCADCKASAIENHALPTARRRIRLRRACEQCGARKRLQVHHSTPCNGIRTFSCAHHLSNLVLLCDQCHAEQHREAA
jgi:hypothetical protein